MKARAAVAWAPKKPLEIEEVDVMGPKEGYAGHVIPRDEPDS